MVAFILHHQQVCALIDPCWLISVIMIPSIISLSYPSCDTIGRRRSFGDTDDTKKRPNAAGGSAALPSLDSDFFGVSADHGK